MHHNLEHLTARERALAWLSDAEACAERADYQGAAAGASLALRLLVACDDPDITALHRRAHSIMYDCLYHLPGTLLEVSNAST